MDNIKDKNGVNNAKKTKWEMPTVDRILNAIQQRGMFTAFKRYRYPYGVEDALKVIEAIGKARNPRFVIDDENRHAYANFAKWCHGDETMRAIDPVTGAEVPGRLKAGIYIAGNTGSGKSWCLEIMLAYATAMGFKVIFTGDNEPRPLWWRVCRTDAICDDFAANGTLQLYKKQPLLGLQDVGAEPAETLYMGNRVDTVRQILEFRGDMTDKITLITSNLKLNGDNLKARYGDRVQSRLMEMCNYLVIHGRDRRKQ